MTFDEVVSFHGHACPGLALGFRVAGLALQEMKMRAKDEELVAIVENNSCAVDAIQAMLGCTFGKGNLVFKDYGKQVYTMIRRPSGEAVRIAVIWEPTATEVETAEENRMWKRYSEGDRSEEVMRVVHARKTRKMRSILEAEDNELFKVSHLTAPFPEPARIYPSIRCDLCGEKAMAPKTRKQGNKTLCIPCSEM